MVHYHKVYFFVFMGWNAAVCLGFEPYKLVIHSLSLRFYFSKQVPFLILDPGVCADFVDHKRVDHTADDAHNRQSLDKFGGQQGVG